MEIAKERNGSGMNSQMKKGILEMCILYQFLRGDFYGYDIIVTMKSYFPDVNDSSFYVILRRLEALGYTESYEGKESCGPTRKYYKITEKGKEYLACLIESWKKIKNIVEKIGI